MYTNLYVYKAPRQFMSGKLYWRIKKDRKWTWLAATEDNTLFVPGITKVTSLIYCKEEEE